MGDRDAVIQSKCRPCTRKGTSRGRSLEKKYQIGMIRAHGPKVVGKGKLGIETVSQRKEQEKKGARRPSTPCNLRRRVKESLQITVK